ncbi:MAG TPA: DUF177 domain-containing protein [Bacillota bacterium]|nr:DUF177 domain-containing protein [Bacillota bacterium]
MQIDVEGLREEKGSTMSIDMAEDFPSIDLIRSELVFVEPVRFVGQATNTGRRIVVTGIAYGRARATCDRCLSEFELPLESSILETYYRSDEAPDSPDEDEREYGEDNIVDIAPAIEQAFILLLPIRIVCDEGCKGLCPQCGHNLNWGDCSCPPDESWGLFQRAKIIHKE